MRRFILTVLIIGIGYLFFEEWKGDRGPDTAFRMPALETPASVGRFTETSRDDLFVATGRSVEYSVPADVINATTTHSRSGRRWYAYRPETTDQELPVVLLFHGAGRNGLSMIDMWRDVADQEGLYLIALNGSGQNWPREGVFPTILHDILADAQDIAPIDMNRVYLFGHSNGASYVQTLLNQTEGPWRAAAVHGGFSNPRSAINPADPKPIRYYLGTRDHIFKPDVARVVADILAQRGHSVDIQFIPGNTHWFYEAGPIIAADAWTWFERQ